MLGTWPGLFHSQFLFVGGCGILGVKENFLRAKASGTETGKTTRPLHEGTFDWSLYASEAYEACWVEMGQGPSESGLHPNMDLPFEEHSPRVYPEYGKKDTKRRPRRPSALAWPQLLWRPRMIIIRAYIY